MPKLYQVVIAATLINSLASSSVTLQPQFEAEDEDEAKAKLDAWLEKTGYKADGEPSFTEVAVPAEPGPEPLADGAASSDTPPPADDGSTPPQS